MKIDDSWYIKPTDKDFPHKTNAGGVVVRKSGSEILIALIRDRKYADFNLPKGGKESGEDLLDTAIREISEETGIADLKFVCELGTGERLTFEKDKWATTHYFLFTTKEEKGNQNLQEDEDFEVSWFNIENLPDMFWPEQEKLIKDNLGKIKASI